MTSYEVLNNISVIIQIILFITLIIIVIYLSGYIKKLMLKVENLQQDVNKFKVTVEPLIDDTRILVKKLNNVFEKVDDNMETVKSMIEKIKDTVDSIIELEQRIQHKIESPVIDAVNSFAAIIKGIKVFFETIKSPKPGRVLREYPVLPEENTVEEEILFDDEIQDEFNDINKELNEVRKKLEEMKKV